jgi:cytochrome c
MKKCLGSFAAASAFCLAAAPALAQDVQKLLKEKACVACHAPDKKLVGPSHKEVADKYRSRKDAVEYLAKTIREGSTGVWGPVPMPPNATVSEAEARALAKYILSLK